MAQLQTLLLLTVLSLTSCTKPKLEKNSNTFIINLPREIHSVDPLLLRGTAKRYVLFNVHRGLFFYDKKNKLQAHGAKSCEWTGPKILVCSLSKKRWSDGSPIGAKHYIYTYEQIKKLTDESLADLKDILSMKALGDSKIEFIFSKKVSEVRHRLTTLALSPRKKNQLYHNHLDQVFSGPFKVQSLDKKSILLRSNQYYDGHKRPDVKGVFVDDPSAALNMFESGQLDFLRYLESSNVRAYKNVLLSPFAKLDGLFFNSEKLSLSARKALIYSLDFNGLQKIYNNPARPGCLAVPDHFFQKGESVDCLKKDLVKAQSYLKKSELDKIKLKIHLPAVDTGEHKKLALWARAEWQKNLSIDVQIEIHEKKMFYAEVEKGSYSIYRKAHPLSDLSCASAVNSLNNGFEFKDLPPGGALDCGLFFKKALGLQNWVPLGMPYYAHLPSEKFSGYYINLLGQFGLEALQRKK